LPVPGDTNNNLIDFAQKDGLDTASCLAFFPLAGFEARYFTFFGVRANLWSHGRKASSWFKILRFEIVMAAMMQ
jgi:hypothetical protein